MFFLLWLELERESCADYSGCSHAIYVVTGRCPDGRALALERVDTLLLFNTILGCNTK